jgi:hypothetical protein
MSDSQAEREAALGLLSAAAVRSRARQVLEAGLAGALDHFAVVPAALGAVADRVAAVTRETYPDLDVPLHARWRHFAAGGVDRWAVLAGAADWHDDPARARAAFDLVIVSVLLDAGAGTWSYREPATGRHYDRSEGLAVASFDMFVDGVFSDRPGDALRADAAALAAVTSDRLGQGFQVGEANPLLGLDGRATLLMRLGQTVAAQPEVFALADSPRPGGLYDWLAREARDGMLPAEAVLKAVLFYLGPVWPGRIALGGVALGDTWYHPAVRAEDASNGLMPLHKLSQWLTYSLVEPLEAAGIRVTELDALTGLAEYRNGGLLIDAGALRPRDPAVLGQVHDADSEFVVEWRALTIALLDELAPLVRERLGVGAANFPLAKILQGGTWAAGRRLARKLRPDGGPPFAVSSDGTLF